jgi:uncharacterized lipoprotein YajG
MKKMLFVIVAVALIAACNAPSASVSTTDSTAVAVDSTELEIGIDTVTTDVIATDSVN